MRSRQTPLASIPPPITVRRLRPGDDAVLDHLATHNSGFGSMGERPQLEPLSQTETVTLLADDRTAVFVAFAGDEPVGFCYANELFRRHTALRHLCLYELAVSDRHRGQGIGAALLEAVGDHARSRGISRGFAVGSVEDRAAAELYEAAGAAPSGDEVVYAFTWD